MPAFRAADPSVFERRPSAPRAAADPDLTHMVARLSRIKDPSLVYEVTLEKGDQASTVRTRLLRAARIAGVEVAVRRSPRGGWYVGQMTPERRSRAGRRPRTAP